MSDASDSLDQGNKYKSSVQRYLNNQHTKKHLGKEKKLTTTINKGEFNFLVHRLNMPTKRNEEDYKKYLDISDISSLQALTSELIEKGVFDADFLRRLDAFFIKERLQKIISVGRKILALGSTDLSTDKAQEVITEMKAVDSSRKSVKQLETLWQWYFERYLLYLIFSYKEIYPKVELELEGDKKYPDFIGINHYYGVDAIEIKTHLLPVLVRDDSHDNFAFSADFSKAIIQTTNYIDAIKKESFKETADREKITRTTHEENLSRPRGVIIISSADKLVHRQGQYDQTKVTRDFTKLRNSLHNIEVLTFDEILDMADHYANKIASEASE